MMKSNTMNEKIIKERNKNVNGMKTFSYHPQNNTNDSSCKLILDISENIFRTKLENCIGCF